MRWTVQGLAGGPRRVNHASVDVEKFIYSFGGKTERLILTYHFDAQNCMYEVWLCNSLLALLNCLKL